MTPADPSPHLGAVLVPEALYARARYGGSRTQALVLERVERLNVSPAPGLRGVVLLTRLRVCALADRRRFSSRDGSYTHRLAITHPRLVPRWSRHELTGGSGSHRDQGSSRRLPATWRWTSSVAARRPSRAPRWGRSHSTARTHDPGYSSTSTYCRLASESEIISNWSPCARARGPKNLGSRGHVGSS